MNVVSRAHDVAMLRHASTTLFRVTCGTNGVVYTRMLYRCPHPRVRRRSHIHLYDQRYLLNNPVLQTRQNTYVALVDTSAANCQPILPTHGAHVFLHPRNAYSTMSSDADYASFLDKANQDTGSGTSSTQSKTAKSNAVNTEVPEKLQSVEETYTSDADEPFEPVSLKWEGRSIPSASESSTGSLQSPGLLTFQRGSGRVGWAGCG